MTFTEHPTDAAIISRDEDRVKCVDELTQGDLLAEFAGYDETAMSNLFDTGRREATWNALN